MTKERNSGTLVFQRPPKPELRQTGEACLILLYPPGPQMGRRVALAGHSYTIGRAGDCDISIETDSVSRKHAKLSRINDQWVMEDLQSTNGSFVNDRPTAQAALRDGDQLRFGDAIFKFLSGSNVEAAYHEEIYRMTILDGLTQIHNKRYLLEFLERELASSHRHGHPLTLVMFDIDFFKKTNDEHGHLAGDAVLKELAARIRPRIRREDLFARYGGEEFAAVLNVTDLGGGVHFAESLRHLVAERPVPWQDTVIPVSISLGVACVHNEPAVSVPELIRRADEKLYEAKRSGRNRVVS